MTACFPHVSGRVSVGLLALCLVASSANPVAARAKRVAGVDPCASEGPAPGPGSLDPFRPPVLRAAELNAAGKIPYRQGKWEDARAQYRAAEAADPELLAAKLNIACSFVRQERFTDATAEVVGLLERGYVPWAREIEEAADLGALKARPESQEIKRALAASAARWSEDLPTSVLFVARKSPPLHVPDGPGVFILNPHQEVWAFTPRTRRYRQLTAEDGHVVALARSLDGRSLVFVTADKLVRAGAGGARKPTELALRGVALHELSLVTMATGPSATLEGDVRKLEIRVGATGSFIFDLEGTVETGAFTFAASGALVASSSGSGATSPLTTLTPRGPSTLKGTAPRGGGCDARVTEREAGGLRTLTYRPSWGAPVLLAPRNGAGRVGLPIP